MYATNRPSTIVIGDLVFFYIHGGRDQAYVVGFAPGEDDAVVVVASEGNIGMPMNRWFIGGVITHDKAEALRLRRILLDKHPEMLKPIREIGGKTMADFCQQCSVREFGEDYGDLSGIATRPGFYALVLCEGCGAIQVDSEGRCVSEDCLERHGVGRE